ncbi:MAG: hypothetical protein MI923_10740, partial [Phycisphaerales bacterium]|nr:hypothetical protein [Phycisphaerales bacterium]
YHIPPRFQLVPVFLTEGTCLTLWWDFLVVAKQIILKGKETIQLQIDWFWRVFLSERLPRMENFIQAIDTLGCRI